MQSELNQDQVYQIKLIKIQCFNFSVFTNSHI